MCVLLLETEKASQREHLSDDVLVLVKVQNREVAQSLKSKPDDPKSPVSNESNPNPSSSGCVKWEWE